MNQDKGYCGNDFDDEIETFEEYLEREIKSRKEYKILFSEGSWKIKYYDKYSVVLKENAIKIEEVKEISKQIEAYKR